MSHCSKQWNSARRRSWKKRRGKGANHRVWRWWLASVEDDVRLVATLMESLATGVAAAHVAEVAATVLGTLVAHGWSSWNGWGESHRPCCYWEGRKWLDEVVVVVVVVVAAAAVGVAMAEQKSFAEERERGGATTMWGGQAVACGGGCGGKDAGESGGGCGWL